MSEKFTSISLKGQRDWIGYSDRGEKTVEEMVATARRQADYLRAEAAAIDAAADEDFHIEVIRGVYVRHHIKTLQEGRPE